MALIFFNGNITTSATEQNLFDETSERFFATWIFTHNMQAGDSVIIRVYVHDENTGTLRTYESVTLSGLQTDPSRFVTFLPTKRYKVSIQRTAGTDRLFSWQRIESS